MPPRRETRAGGNDNNQGEIPAEGNMENNQEAPQPDPVVQLVDLLRTALENPGPRRNPHPVHNPAATITFKDFKNVGPPEFKGTTDPIEAKAWLKEIEKAFEVARVAENQKTSFAAYMLKGEANFWWEVSKVRAGAGVIPWTRFEELFLEQYFPTSLQNSMEVKFLELKQGNMTVSQYAAKFNELARFAPHQVNTEERKARRFERGLNPWLYNKLSILQIDDFTTLLNKAIIAEEGSDKVNKYKQDKNNEGSSNPEKGNGGNRKRKWNSNEKQQGEEKIEACKTCGKNHVGECLQRRNICYKCGEEGHIRSNCPNLPKRNCYICGAPDHLANVCPQQGKESGGTSERE